MDILALVILIVSAMFLFGMAVIEDRKAQKEREIKYKEIRDTLTFISRGIYDINYTLRILCNEKKKNK